MGGGVKIQINGIFSTVFERPIDNFFFNIRRNRIYNQNSKKIKSLKNLHKNERCFIIGTGPSLNNTDLDLIKNEIIFGVNTLYRGFKKFSFKCNYYAITDLEVWEKNYNNILELNSKIFLSGGACENYLSNYKQFKDYKTDNLYLIKYLGNMWSLNQFSKDLSEGTYNGDTIIIDICLQAAYYLGFNQVYLLGCDCDYSGMHRFDGSITENLRGGGVSGDWSKVFASYEICKKIYEENVRKIINCTVGGKLEIFERKKLEEII